MSNDLIRVLIADDHEQFCHGLESLLRTAPGVEVVGTARTGTQAISLAAELQPDVVLMDLRMPEKNGIEATKHVVGTSPHIRIIVFTMFDDDDSVFEALRAGARGYLLKGAGRDEIVRAVHAVSYGEAIFGASVASRIASYFASSQPKDVAFPQLSDREREVLTMIANGLGNQEIAETLFLSPKTVRNHISNIFIKLQVADRTHAIIMARDAGLARTDKPWT